MIFKEDREGKKNRGERKCICHVCQTHINLG